MAKVVCFGEVMLRLQPYHYERFVQAENVQFTFGGAEANVAVSLANFGVDVSYVNKLCFFSTASLNLLQTLVYPELAI